MLARERIIEIVVAVTAVFLMIGTMYGIGLTYGADEGGLSAEGGEMLVGVIVAFIVLLTIMGLALAFVTNEPEDESEDEDPNAGTTA